MPAPEGKGMWIRHRDGLFLNAEYQWTLVTACALIFAQTEQF
jgi:hypothetical protein